MTNAAVDIPLNLIRPSTPYTATVVENTDLTPDSSEDVRHLVFDLGESGLRYLEGQSIGVIAPGQDDKGKPHRLRLYSIASSRDGDDGAAKTISLCVKRTIYTNEAGEEVRGLCSNHLNDLAPGDPVQICGPIGKHFLLPPDAAEPILMFATGTGIAPFRAFLKHRARFADRGPAFLLFGVRTTTDLLYVDELQALLDRPGDRLLLAISREQTNAKGGRMYVGDRLPELAAEVAPLLAEGKLMVYQCGLKGMETGVEAACTEMLAERGVDFAALKVELVKAKRWLVDTY